MNGWFLWYHLDKYTYHTWILWAFFTSKVKLWWFVRQDWGIDAVLNCGGPEWVAFESVWQVDGRVDIYILLWNTGSWRSFTYIDWLRVIIPCNEPWGQTKKTLVTCDLPGPVCPNCLLVWPSNPPCCWIRLGQWIFWWLYAFYPLLCGMPD